MRKYIFIVLIASAVIAVFINKYINTMDESMNYEKCLKAISKGDIEIVRQYIAAGGNVNHQDSDGRCLLINAICSFKINMDLILCF